jgi:hypothetical protein
VLGHTEERLLGLLDALLDRERDLVGLAVADADDSFSSPTTTSAVNEKRRPPLTTLATRLISTTRSWRSRPAELTVLSIRIREREG